MQKIVFVSLLTVSLFYQKAESQELKRLGFKGFARAPITAAIAESKGLTNIDGVVVTRIVPGSTAEVLQLKEGDILTAINNVKVKVAPDLLKPEFNFREGDMVTYTVMREKKEIVLSGKAVPMPLETSPALNVEYSSFKFKQGSIRSIYIKPKTEGKKPAILFIPGYPCASVDNPGPNHPYRKLLYGLAEKGYIVMRAEKTGVGDSYNCPDCNTTDFATEVAGFREALSSLKKHPEVDSNNIFILGHSMGGQEAPYVAVNNNVKGIIVMGIAMRPWLEYLTEMLSTQNPNLGIEATQHQTDMNLYKTLLHELLVNKKRPSELIKLNKEYERLLKRDFNNTGGDDFLGRDILFSQSLNTINITDAWKKINCKVLSAWGETDIQTINDYSHRELVKVMNAAHPGSATFLELKATDHNFMIIPTMQESYKHNANGTLGTLFATNFNTKVIEEFHSWMQAVTGKK